MNDYQLITLGYTTLDRFLRLENTQAKVFCTLHKEHCLFCLNYADKIPVAEYHETLGGNSANAAVTGARLGIKTATWAVMGDDETGKLAAKIFKQEGVGLDYFSLDPTIESSVHTILNYEGERTILSYGKQVKPQLPEFAPIPWVYLTSLLPGGDEIFDPVAKWVAKHNLILVYQPGHVQLKIPPKDTPRLLKATYMIVMNREEAELYTGLQELKERATISDLARKLHSYGPKIVVITDGSKGSFASDGQTLWFMGIEDVPVIERTGAGDAFTSAFVVALIKGKTIPEAMKWGLLNSQGVIQKIGPQAGILHLSEMEEFLSKGHPQLDVISQPLLS